MKSEHINLSKHINECLHLLMKIGHKQQISSDILSVILMLVTNYFQIIKQYTFP